MPFYKWVCRINKFMDAVCLLAQPKEQFLNSDTEKFASAACH